MKMKRILLAGLILAAAAVMPGYDQVTEIAAMRSAPLTMVIDAGHGGMDSGAVSRDGVSEKDINLAIARALAKEAAGYGVRTVLTRETEDGLYGQENSGGRWSKVEDMKERKRVLTEADPDLVVSVHLNSFMSDSSVRGAQVFYAGTGSQEQKEESKALAEAVQTQLNAEANEGKDRIVLPKNDMYLFREGDRTMILVECGFLSSPEDTALLVRPDYQQKLAGCIMKSIAERYHLRPAEKSKIYVIEGRTKNSE